MNTVSRGLRPRLAIAVIGPDDLVEGVMMAGHQATEAPSKVQLVAVGYREEDETVALLSALQGQIDACLFTGPLPYDIARGAGAMTVPATFVPVNDAALYRTLLKGVTEGACEVSRVSIDTLTVAEVEEAYAEIGVAIAGVHVHAYRGPEPAASIAAFHENLWRSGQVSAAVTCFRSVFHRLLSSGVPALRVLPTQASIRSALSTAVLMGLESSLADSQIAVAIVDVAATRRGSEEQSMYWREEQKLSLHRFLLQEARDMGATVQPSDDHGFLVVTTVGALASSTNGFRAAPFLDRARVHLGVGIHVGVGIGGTARDATSNAGAALAHAREGGTQGFALHAGGELIVLPSGDGDDRSPERSPRRSGGIELLSKLIRVLERTRVGHIDEPHVVNAEEVAELLAVTARSARRALRTLTEEGLAWPLPPGRSTQRGRPRRRYRLVVERLPSEHRHVS
jgi:hypothetical protein